jgi:hypothetical protein
MMREIKASLYLRCRQGRVICRHTMIMLMRIFIVNGDGKKVRVYQGRMLVHARFPIRRMKMQNGQQEQSRQEQNYYSSPLRASRCFG